MAILIAFLAGLVLVVLSLVIVLVRVVRGRFSLSAVVLSFFGVLVGTACGWQNSDSCGLAIGEASDARHLNGRMLTTPVAVGCAKLAYAHRSQPIQVTARSGIVVLTSAYSDGLRVFGVILSVSWLREALAVHFKSCYAGTFRKTSTQRYPYMKEHHMRTGLLTIAFATVLAAFGAVHLAAQAADPLVGTWELNIAKSKYNPGPAPKSETRTYVVVGQDIKATSKGVDADGKPTSGQWTVNYDGKDRPVTGSPAGSPDLDALSLKRIDSFTTEFTLKKAGKVVATGTRTISKDGKIMTITTKGTNAKGQGFNDVEVFDKR